MVAFAIGTWMIVRPKGTRRGRFEAHRYTMIGVYVGGIWIAACSRCCPAGCCTGRCSVPERGASC
jgi:uncharacterized membrane protein